MIRAILLLAFTTLLTITAPARACLWDYDTLIDEQRGLPEVSSILMGKWERHSPFFYEQRVKAMTALLATQPDDQPAIDNLAVAYEKLGQIDKAIEIALDKERRFPDQYTTAANLGTFYLHAGDLDRGIEQIERAIAINPDAHFGREKYQLMVAKYLREAKQDPTVFDRGSFVLPLLVKLNWSGAAAGAKYHIPDELQYGTLRSKPEVDEAITGIVGIIRFGTGTNPHLFAALGDVLAARGDTHLAYRAYRRALDYGHPRPEMMKSNMKAMRDRSERSKSSNYDDHLIDHERADGDAWVKAYQTFEDDALRTNVDLSATHAYAPFYATHGSPRDLPKEGIVPWLWRNNYINYFAMAIGSILVILFVPKLFRRLKGKPGPAKVTTGT